MDREKGPWSFAIVDRQDKVIDALGGIMRRKIAAKERMLLTGVFRYERTRTTIGGYTELRGTDKTKQIVSPAACFFPSGEARTAILETIHNRSKHVCNNTGDRRRCPAERTAAKKHRCIQNAERVVTTEYLEKVMGSNH